MRHYNARYRRPPATCRLVHRAGLRAYEWFYLDCRLPMLMHSGWMTGFYSIHRCGGSVGIDSFVSIAPTSRFTPFIEKMSRAPDAGGARLG